MNDRFNPDGLILSSRYEETMNREVLPYLKAREKQQTVAGDGGKPLYCVAYDADTPRGTVLVLHGFTENAFKFSEIIYSLLQNQFSVVAYDQRGHGRSWRDDRVKADMSLTHVDDFTEYLHDMEAVVSMVLKNMPRPWMIFAHSMGGAVSCLFLERHDDVFGRAALCAPMIAPNSGLPAGATAAVCQGAKLMGKAASRVFISKPYAGPEDFATSCATGKERFDWYDKVRQEHREFWNNGPTYGWTQEALRVGKWLLAPGEAEKIACPVRLFSADDDHSVMPEPQKQFIARVKNGERVFVKGSRHEIYRSGDDVLFPWWHEVLEFLKGNIQK